MAYNKKVVFIVASEGFQHVEYSVPKKLLEEAGIMVETASNKLAPAIAKDGSTTNVNYLVQSIPLDTVDGVFIVGGPGSIEHLDNAHTHKIMQAAVAAGKKIGAICLAPRILARAGVLEGKQATGWDKDNELASIYKEHNVHYKMDDVVRDENVVTAKGPEAAREYGEQIISMLD